MAESWVVGWLAVVAGWLAFGTGEGLLGYGICVPCSKRLPGVRDAFSETFGVKNRLHWYGRDIRYRKPPPTVRNCASVIAFYDVWKEATVCSLQGHN